MQIYEQEVTCGHSAETTTDRMTSTKTCDDDESKDEGVQIVYKIGGDIGYGPNVLFSTGYSTMSTQHESMTQMYAFDGYKQK